MENFADKPTVIPVTHCDPEKNIRKQPGGNSGLNFLFVVGKILDHGTFAVVHENVVDK